MNKHWVIFTAALSLGAIAATAADIKSAADLKDARSKASYGLGLQAVNVWKSRGADIDWDAYIKALRDGAGGASPLISDAEVREAMAQFQKDSQARYQAKLEEDGIRNKAASEKFLADNKGKEGVQSTPSGLQYKVVKMGDGPKPKATDKVTVHYTGKVLDGKKFDSSVDRGQPFTFVIGVGQVIKGWDEGVATMKVGGKRNLIIPAALAYGSRGQGPIPPNTDLYFEVELLAVQ